MSASPEIPRRYLEFRVSLDEIPRFASWKWRCDQWDILRTDDMDSSARSLTFFSKGRGCGDTYLDKSVMVCDKT